MVAAACGGDKGTGTYTPVATTLELATAAPASGIVGSALPTSPSFVVEDQKGKPMAGVPVSIAVAGGGSLAAAPTQSADGPTPVGTWTLGTTPGANTLTVTAGALTPLVISVQAAPGAITSLEPLTATSVNAIVAQTLTPSARGLDVFGNAGSGKVATVTVSGGGTAPASVTANAEGIFTVPSWTLGTTPGINTLSIASGSAVVQFTANTIAGTPASIVVTSGNNQQQFAGRNVAQPVVFTVRDQLGNGIPGVTVSFSATAGGGSVSSGSAVSGADGTVAAPAWRLGTSAVPQQLRATASTGTGTVSANASATVQTAMNVDIRFFGSPMTTDQQALFFAAAARIAAMVTGDLEPVNGFGIDLATFCETPGLPTLNEVVDDVIIYASIASIDGPGQVLAQAGPCAVRSTGSQLPIIGVMEFDSADLASLTGGGSLQDVITHEMMHVMGIGTYWNSSGLLSGYNTAAVAYIGANGTSGCRAVGGTSICATTVPVENTGGAGTANSHWRESVFGNELMTGYANAGSMPISRMTIGAFLDIGYAVNYDAAAAYQIPGTSAALFSIQRSTIGTPAAAWERMLEPKILITRDGKVTGRQ